MCFFNEKIVNLTKWPVLMCITEQVNWNLYCTLWFPYFGTFRRKKSSLSPQSCPLGLQQEFSSCFLAKVRNKSWTFSQADIVHFTSPAFSWHSSMTHWSVDRQHTTQILQNKGSPVSSLPVRNFL